MRTGRPSTLAEVAARAGVSLTTASKVINGQARVSDATRARVLQAARELTYTPNPMARSLVSGRSGTVGMIIVDSVSQRWAMPIMLGAEEALSQIDLTMIISDARGDRARLQHIVDRFRERKVDGVLVLGDNNVRTPVLAPRLDRPTVYVYGETGGRDVVHVPDDAAGGALVAEHVLALGRRRVASVTGPEGARAVVQRSAGMQQALDAAGLALVAPAAHVGWSQRAARAAAGQLLEGAPDVGAIVCGSDQIAAGVVEAVRASGRRIPDDVAVTGYDNWPIFALECEPPLTTVDMNLEALGAAAVRDLFGVIDGLPVGGGVRLHAPTLVVRGSTTA